MYCREPVLLADKTKMANFAEDYASIPNAQDTAYNLPQRKSISNTIQCNHELLYFEVTLFDTG